MPHDILRAGRGGERAKVGIVGAVREKGSKVKLPARHVPAAGKRVQGNSEPLTDFLD